MPCLGRRDVVFVFSGVTLFGRVLLDPHAALADAPKPAPADVQAGAAANVPARATSSSDATFDHKPKTTNEPISLQLENADLSDLVRVMSEITGKRFVLANPKLASVKASIYASQKVNVAEAYQAFLAVLTANGLTVVPHRGFHRIVESQDIARQLTPLERGELSPEERYVTRVHRLAHLAPEDVATTVLAKLQTKDASIIPYNGVLIITETAANLRRMLDLLAILDQGGEEDKIWFRRVQHLSSAHIEKQLTDLLALKGKGDAKGDSSAARSTGADGAALHVARIVAIERPNALVVVGTKASYERVAALVDIIDVAAANEMKVQVVMLQHADAKKIVQPINEALGAVADATMASGAAPSVGTAARPSGGASPSAPTGALEAAVKVAADETTNALIVTATPRDFAYLREVIRALDRPKRQVFIEAAILDISVGRGTDVGVAWHGGHVDDAAIGPDGKDQTVYGGWRSGSSAGGPSTSDLQAFALGVRGPEIPFLSAIPGVSRIPSFGAFLSAIATSKGADILSTPSILASDNTTAELKVQLQTSLQPNAPTISTQAFGLPGTGIPGAGIPGFPGALPTSSNVGGNYRGIGPQIKVTPHLNDSDEVRLDVIEVISDIQNSPSKNDTFGTVSYLERTASTTLTVKDGRTVVIGGLVRNRLTREETKVPILGDIPVLGALFRNRNDTMEKSNLVLVLTPYIIRDESDMVRVLERKQQERREIIDREALFRGSEWAAPHDWTRTRGLLAHVQGSYADLARRRREADELAPHDAVKAAPEPLDLPVPSTEGTSGAGSGGGAARPGGNGATPARPAIER